MKTKIIYSDGVEVTVELPDPGVPGTCDSLPVAQRLMADEMAYGVECPCCGQFAMVYRRRLNSGMAATLAWLVRKYLNNGRKWVTVKEGPRFVVNSREIGKLRHWGLVELRQMDGSTEENEDKKTSGMWRPTEAGIEFAMNRSRLPKYVYLYNNKVCDFGGESISIVEALAKKFSYQELMGDIN